MEKYEPIEKLYYSENVIAKIENTTMPIMLWEEEQDIVIEALTMYQFYVKNKYNC